MTLPEYEAQFDKHDIRCELEGEKENYEVTLQIRPKVAFKQGKAVKASLNWGKIDAPKLAKTALWSATAADNSFGVLQSTVVEDINEFIQTPMHGGEGGVAGQVASLSGRPQPRRQAGSVPGRPSGEQGCARRRWN